MQVHLMGYLFHSSGVCTDYSGPPCHTITQVSRWIYSSKDDGLFQCDIFSLVYTPSGSGEEGEDGCR